MHCTAPTRVYCTACMLGHLHGDWLLCVFHLSVSDGFLTLNILSSKVFLAISRLTSPQIERHVEIACENLYGENMCAILMRLVFNVKRLEGNYEELYMCVFLQ